MNRYDLFNQDDVGITITLITKRYKPCKTKTVEKEKMFWIFWISFEYRVPFLLLT